MAKRTLTEWALELVIVVLGIWIALFANNWNLERKERIEERAVLQRIARDLEAEFAEIERVVTATQVDIDELERFAEVTKVRDEAAEAEAAKIYLRLTHWEYLATKNFTYGSLAQSGRLQLLTSIELTTALARMHAAHEDAMRQSGAVSTILTDLLTHEIFERVDIRTRRFIDTADAYSVRVSNQITLGASIHLEFLRYVNLYKAACEDVRNALRDLGTAG